LRTRLAVLALAGAVLLPFPAAAEPPESQPSPAPASTPPAPATAAPVKPGAPPAIPHDSWAQLLSDRPAPPSGPAAGVAGTEAAAPGDPIRWRRCGSADLRFAGARCARVQVPLDHADPAGPTISLAVSRVRHTVSERRYRGVMLVNPGGPGASGLIYSTIGHSLPAKVGNAYDWIGFDPRGVGSSQPALRCDPEYFGFDRPNYIPRRKADRSAWLRRSRGYAKDCAENNGAILRHMRTEDVARDMDWLRTSLGVERISYYGFSYGTYLGQVYATLFPHRVRRMVLDSNIDPRDVFYRSNLKQNIGIDRTMRLWLRWMADRAKTYRVGSTRKAVQKTFVRTRNRLARKPAAGKIGGSEWTDIFNSVAYTRDVWPRLARLMARYVHKGRAKPLVRAYRSVAGSGKDNLYAVYLAVQCTDAPWPHKWSRWSRDNRRVAKLAPLTTWLNAWFNMPCRTWSVPAGRRIDVRGRNLPRTLLVSGTLDGPTPYANSLAVRRLTAKARLVAIQGETTHAASANGIPCVSKRIRAYLVGGDLPKRRTGNRADVVCPRR
jgi:pimeloyl-ACP methyl ester carboxylesterase